MVLELDLALIGTVIALLSSIGAGAWWLHKIAVRFERLEKQAEHRKEDDQVILLALMATLDGLLSPSRFDGQVIASFFARNRKIS